VRRDSKSWLACELPLGARSAPATDRYFTTKVPVMIVGCTSQWKK
jgi:hypothetical protein